MTSFSILLFVIGILAGLFFRSRVLEGHSKLMSRKYNASNRNARKVFMEFQKVLPKERLLWKSEDIVEYSRYRSVDIIGNPDMVVFPVTTEEVSRIMKICYKNNMIVIPMGLNTAVEGQLATTKGGVVVNMMKMNKVVSVHPEDYQAVVEAGIRISELNEVLKPHNLFFPVSPSSNPTLGGSAGTSGSGMLTPSYLTVKENIISLTAVLPSGEIVMTGRRSPKSSSGYDLTSLFIGSEGTLGIITKLVVRAVTIPKYLSAATVHFSSGIHGASKTVVKLLEGKNHGISRLEIVNKQGIISLNDHMGTNHEEAPALFLELFGETKEEVIERCRKAEEISNNFGGENFQYSFEEEEMELLWKTRMSAFYAFLNCREDCLVDAANDDDDDDQTCQNTEKKKERKRSCNLFATDYCVPISELGNFIEFCDQTFEEKAPMFKGNLVVHAACGNLHHGILIDYDKPEEVELMNEIHRILAKKTIELDGTVAGEHGIGIKMKELMKLEYNKPTIDLMRKIKIAVDPKNMMNPGKIF